ncbi:MAG: TolC family protein [Daejeonella sp.]
MKLKKAFLFFLLNGCLSGLGFSSFSQERTIEDYIKMGTNNSPLLKDFNNQILINKLDSAIIRANYKPLVGANSTGTYAPIIRGYGYDLAISNGKTFSALVSVNQSLLGRSRMNTALRGIGLLSDSVTNAVQRSQQDIRRNIISQYISAYASQKQVEFDQTVYQLLKKEETVLKKLTQGNVYRQTDYLTFLVTLQQQELQMKQNQIVALNNIAILNYLSGIVSTDSVKLIEPKLNLNAAQQLNSSIFLQQFQLDSLRIQNSRRVIDLNYQPRVGVYADGGYNSSFIQKAYKNVGVSAGFTISIPLYDGHQRKLQYNKLDIRERTRSTYRDYFLVQYQQQLSQLRQQLQQQESLFDKINEQIRFTESLITVDGKLLQTGNITIADYILAIRNYLDSQSLLRQTNITRLELINQLNYWNQ